MLIEGYVRIELLKTTKKTNSDQALSQSKNNSNFTS